MGLLICLQPPPPLVLTFSEWVSWSTASYLVSELTEDAFHFFGLVRVCLSAYLLLSPSSSNLFF